MRALAWLRKLRRNSKGNVLIMTAVSMPMIIGGAGMAIDSIQLTVWKRQLQRAADSAAIAGAYGEARGDDANTAVHRDLDRNFFPTLSEPEVVETGPRLGFERTVYVQLTAERTLPFMSFFTGGTPTTIRTEATAALDPEGVYCMVSLFDEEGTGIDVTGNGTLTLGCGMVTNATGDDAVQAGGSSEVTASPIAAVGGIDGESNNFVGTTVLQPYTTPQQDPLSHLPDPPAQSGCLPDPDVQPSETPDPLEPGCYEGLSVQGNLTLEAGTYFITGDIHFNAGANITGDGVTIVMTGDDGEAGDLDINGSATLNLTAPESGDYAGVLFFRDRRASNETITINGGADINLHGALYFPTSNVTFSGNAEMDMTCLQLVGWILNFQGDTSISNECPTGGAAQPFEHLVVRLVG